ncbi:carbonic anhydrase [Bathymodiolus japonicus methanotrophic gill symbiont]|uniref:bifunctional SulP family inorganic anion transporter/carbonic anhydrase n=1 Tax=Bathymodiolus japonicus methanotrophic gill symbiont TaxID=113269 RepID=UPI001B472FD7|nr:carbonic anhydrase family protein [Bathymodiolus japonicus methanotrophic gill symbiont]GFO72223.1 carbonic anhydrase [Bathymodiolus japonicus methanotrophic gill symbiont]
MIKKPLLTENDLLLNYKASFRYDLPASIVVFVLALPLCLGIALASGAPLSAGLIAGVIGGIVVTSLSGSSLGVSGPAAGMAVIVFSAIAEIGFEAVLLAVVLAGVLQFILGKLGAGVIGYYFPSAVIAGMLSGIGIIIFLKQIPHAVGYDQDYEGDLSFVQGDDYTTLSELGHMVDFIAPGAVVISLLSLGLILLWETDWIKQYRFRRWLHGSVMAVVVGGILNQLFIYFYPAWALGVSHLVNLPVVETYGDIMNLITLPDFSQIDNPAIYPVAFTIAIVASLETLLCVEAVDKLDPYTRVTSNNRELRAQGIGNICSGLLGGLPMTQLIVRSSANIQMGGRTKMAALIQGLFLLIAVLLIPELVNKIPLASLAAILLVVGYKLAQPASFKTMYQVGYFHFLPFTATIFGLIFSDMLTGISIGMAFALFFILLENLQVGFHLHEQHKLNKTVITLSENVSFLNKSKILHILSNLPAKSNVVIDATYAKYIDYDVYEMIQNFKVEARRKKIKLVIQNLRGFGFLEPVERALPITKESQQALSPKDVLEILKSGNTRFVNSLRNNRNLLEQANESVGGQFPIAIILSCIDSRTSAELIFDQGLGDIFSVRVAGNVVNDDILGSMEYACKAAGSKLVVVLGHTHCGAIKGACSGIELGNLTNLLDKIQPAVAFVKSGKHTTNISLDNSLEEKVAERNVEIMVEQVKQRSEVLVQLESAAEIAIVGAMYNIETGIVEFFD